MIKVVIDHKKDEYQFKFAMIYSKLNALTIAVLKKSMFLPECVKLPLNEIFNDTTGNCE